MNWIFLAFLAMLAFSGMVLVFKKISLLGVSPAVLMLFVAIFLTVFYALHVFITKTPIQVNGSSFVWLLFAGVLSYLGNLFYTKSISLAPNPGYVVTIAGLQFAVIAVASFFLFQSEFTLVKGVGVFLAIIAGVLMLV